MADGNNTLSPRFLALENAQNVEKVASIFSGNNPLYTLKPNPLFVILVGAPGVGKTTKAKEFLYNELGVDYNSFYNIALDSLVEKVIPYREATKRIHNTLKNRRAPAQLTNENYAILSEAYLQTIMSNKTNFTLPRTTKRILNKIEGIKNTAKKTSTKKNNISGLKNLNAIRRDGLIYGVTHGLNILYDTTLTKTKDKIRTDIMPILEEFKDNTKYKIIVILVTASEKDIKKRLKVRHESMITESDPYIRAVSPLLVSKFIKENKSAFDEARAYYESGNYEESVDDTIYTSDDFTFKEIYNPQIIDVKTKIKLN